MNRSLVLIVVGVSLVAPAQAAEVIEEIVVTAQKRSENLQDVPIAVSVVTQESMNELDYTNITDLQFVVPSLKFAESVHPRGEGFAIRGVGTNTFSVAAESSVGAVIDGLVVGQYGAAVFDFADLDQVEVLRGPQGMLFGKNATAGVLNIRTNRPDLQGNEYRVRASGSVRGGDHYDNKLEGVANLVLGEGLGLRLVGARSDQDGFVENVFDGSEMNGREEYGLKGKLLWQPRDDLELYFTAGYASRDADCCMWTTRTAPPGNAIADAQAPVVAAPDNEAVNLDGPVYHEMEMSSASLEINYDLAGGHVLTSITGLRSWEITLNADSDQRPIDSFNINFGDTEQDQFSQEIRIASPSGQPLEYVAGLYYYRQDVDSFTRQVLNTGTLRLGRDARPEFETSNMAVFAQATYALTESLRLIAGGRYTDEELEGEFTRVVTPGTDLPLTAPLTFDFETDADEPSWRFGVQYDVGDAMVYATASRGFKGPTANILADFNEPDNDAILVDPETATSYEVGLKSTWLEGRLTANVAVYDTEFEDFQAQTFDVNRDPAVFRIANAGELSTRGVEVEVVSLLSDSLTVSGSVTYMDAEYDQFRTTCYPFQTVAQGCEPVPGTPGAFDTDASDNPLAGAPDWTYTLTASYTRPLNGSMDWHVLGNYYWQDEVNFSAAGDPNTLLDSYGIFNLNVGIGSQDGRWRVSAFAKNLFDEHYVNSLLGTPLGFAAPPNPAASYSQRPAWQAERILGLSLELSLE